MQCSQRSGGPVGPGGGLPRALDRTGRQNAVHTHLVEDGGPCKVRHFSVGEGRGLQGPSHFIPQTRNETAEGPWSFYFLADCGGRRGQRSLAVGRGATFEKDRTGPPPAAPRRPAPGWTDRPVANTVPYRQLQF